MLLLRLMISGALFYCISLPAHQVTPDEIIMFLDAADRHLSDPITYHQGLQDVYLVTHKDAVYQKPYLRGRLLESLKLVSSCLSSALLPDYNVLAHEVLSHACAQWPHGLEKIQVFKWTEQVKNKMEASARKQKSNSIVKENFGDVKKEDVSIADAQVQEQKKDLFISALSSEEKPKKVIKCRVKKAKKVQEKKIQGKKPKEKKVSKKKSARDDLSLQAPATQVSEQSVQSSGDGTSVIFNGGPVVNGTGGAMQAPAPKKTRKSREKKSKPVDVVLVNNDTSALQ